MIRFPMPASLRVFLVVVALVFGFGAILSQVSGAAAQTSSDSHKDPKKKTKPTKNQKNTKGKASKTPSKNAKGKSSTAKTGKTDKPKATDIAKPQHIQTFGSWGVFTTAGKGKTCYILAQPKERLPSNVKRDPGYVFISTRPNENVRNEISFTVGYEVKTDAKPEPKLEIGPETFSLLASGSNLWLKNAAENGSVLDKLRRGGKAVVRATSQRGTQTSDSYPLAGLAQALDRLTKECP
jgi:hypothetical protein